MELWIRSQDKYAIMKPNSIYNFENAICCDCNGKRKLGEYKSQERALEVLDEIQSRLDAFVNNDYLKNVTDVSKQVYIAPFIVYEMPSE